MSANEGDLFVCGKHTIVMMYRGDSCPWCDFINDMKLQLETEYKRGFADGVQAAEAEAAKEAHAERGDVGKG